MGARAGAEHKDRRARKQGRGRVEPGLNQLTGPLASGESATGREPRRQPAEALLPRWV